MIKQLLQRNLPDPHQLRNHKNLRIFGDLLHDPRLWHFNRRYIIRGLTAGAFYAFVPFPWQMLLAAITAVWLRFNLPVAVATVWITNPLTIPPIAYFSYQFGAWLMGRPPVDWAFEPSLAWLLDKAGELGLPLLVGSLTIAVIASTLTFVIAHLIWRWHIIHKFRNRRRRVAPGSI